MGKLVYVWCVHLWPQILIYFRHIPMRFINNYAREVSSGARGYSLPSLAQTHQQGGTLATGIS